MVSQEQTFYKGRIIGKIDYYSSVWYNHSIRDVMEFLHLEDVFDFLLEDFDLVTSALAPNSVKFEWNGVRIEVPLVDLLSISTSLEKAVSSDQIKDHKISKIRLALSGKPLEYLRTKWFVMNGGEFSFDQYLRIPPMLHQKDFHPTRVDFAFDFINYGKDFFSHAFPFLADFRNLTPSGRLSISGMQGGMTYKPVNTPAQKTLYIGSTGADRYLRIYDKCLEVKARNNGEMVEGPYGIPAFEIESWIRVEWQMRAKNAAKFLYAHPKGESNYWMNVLQEIVDFYEFRSCRNKGNVIPKFWRQFFDMERIDGLDKMFDFVYKPGEIDFGKKNDSYIEDIGMNSILLYILRHRETYFISKIRDYWFDLITPKSDLALEEARQCRLRSLRKKLNDTVPEDKTPQEMYPWAFDERGNLCYPRSDFA